MSDTEIHAVARERAGHAAEAEGDHPRVGTIVALFIGVSLVVVALVAGLVQYFNATVRAEILHKQLEPVSSLLRAVRAEEQAKLNRYQWVSREEQIVRIPLARAKELVLADYARSAAAAASAGSAAAAQVVAPAASTSAASSAALGSAAAASSSSAQSSGAQTAVTKPAAMHAGKGRGGP